MAHFEKLWFAAEVTFNAILKTLGEFTGGGGGIFLDGGEEKNFQLVGLSPPYPSSENPA